MELLTVLKALGDETRFSMYQELATSTNALSAGELADRLGLHANTVRLHLERLRKPDWSKSSRSTGAPSGATARLFTRRAPGLGFDPPSYTLLAGLLATLAGTCSAPKPMTTAAGGPGVSRPGGAPARSRGRALTAEMQRLGFDPRPRPVRDPRHRLSALPVPS
jgi:hypothetical protein